jgi:hypothetical protein
VIIKAVSQADPAKIDGCEIRITFDKIFVDAGSGADNTGTGCINAPFRSITRALSMAEGETEVVVRPGIYDQANGEVLSIEIPESVTVVGTDWENCIIREHAALGYQSSVSLYSNHSAFRKFTVEQGEPADTRNCHFHGLFTGIFSKGFTNTLVENCTFEFVAYGVDMCCDHDPDHSPNPDLGGGARGSAGGNLFSDFTNCGLLNPASNYIYAKFNTWENESPVADEDYCNQEDGSIIVE